MHIKTAFKYITVDIGIKLEVFFTLQIEYWSYLARF